MARPKKKNIIMADYGDYLAIDVSTPKLKTAIMYVDKIDWDLYKDTGAGRVGAYAGNSTLYAKVKLNGKVTYFHRIISPNIEIVDHIDHNGLNNKNRNLRGCTASQNAANSIKRVGNTTGFKGVWKNHNKFSAKIGKTHLGTFKTKEEAHSVYCEAAIEKHGEFACFN
jgi:hypothetical protein